MTHSDLAVEMFRQLFDDKAIRQMLSQLPV